jgi:tryptophan 7-halogenase
LRGLTVAERSSAPGAAIRSVLIIGGGTAGWMTAAALGHKLLGTGIAIRLVESAEIGTVGVGEATVPHIRHFNQALGFDEADFMSSTKATFKLGIEFRNWGQVGDSYIHPFGDFGRPIAGAPFIHSWARLRRAGRVGNLDAYSVPVVAARADRFQHPGADPDALESSYSYAYQFDAGLYAAYLRRFSEARGVVRQEGKIVGVARDPAGAGIRSVTLESGETLSADLFVDCSGFRGLLIEGALETGYESWAHWLPCDRAWAVPCANVGPIGPYTRATAAEAGWMWRIPLQHRAGNGHVYASRFLSDEAALAQLLAQLDAEPMAEPRQLRFVPGKRRRQWVGNTVAIGLAAGFLEPLESTSIHLIQVGIETLLDLFPGSAPDPLDASEFNRRMDLEYDRVRDFIILHYCATQRDDSALWRHVRTMALPDSLEEKLELFRGRGVVQTYRHGMFQEPSWLAVYAGQNIVPDHGDPSVEAVSLAEIEDRVAAVAGDVAAAARRLRTHADLLGSLGTAMQG